MDDIDRRILGHLLRSARASYQEIGSGVGLSAPAVKRRVDRMVSSGQITGFTAQQFIDPRGIDPGQPLDQMFPDGCPRTVL
ncbi:AsnC family transcriptional regulator, partial [Nocardia sp.]|uniref:Lrp/AsnC family transcriptional regulator n=1 Tax=Nocardia sp. TaxID=1821 RepID=UPI0025904E67